VTVRQQEPTPPTRRWWRWWGARTAERAARREAAGRLYLTLVKEARTERLYRDLGVPDTPEGRFEMIGLHVALALRRLRAEGAQGQALGQELFDVLFADADVNLRELGVGDLSVGRQVKRWARQFYARLAALDQALGAGDEAALHRMLATNVYGRAAAPRPAQVAALGAHLHEVAAALAAEPRERLLAGAAEVAPHGLSEPGPTPT
jgi:cytochrome b pre-mRNA-processing protein 3